MIAITFSLGSDMILIRIRGHDIMFSNTAYGATWAPIEGIKISQVGAHKEFPDLIGNPNWRVIAIQRFKDRIKDMETEIEVAAYIIEDLKKVGYVPKMMQVDGHRAVAL